MVTYKEKIDRAYVRRAVLSCKFLIFVLENPRRSFFNQDLNRQL